MLKSNTRTLSFFINSIIFIIIIMKFNGTFKNEMLSQINLAKKFEKNYLINI